MSKYLITGGAGFVGANLCRVLLSRGDTVVILDDLSRVGSDDRLHGLQAEGGDQLIAVLADIVDPEAVDGCFETHGPFDGVVHLAAQVAVTWSMQDPRRDFAVNAWGSFNVIDAVRRFSPEARCLYMSSNKVYGALDDLRWIPDHNRCVFLDAPLGVTIKRPLDPETPYGVSKATGECSFRDAWRTYGIQTAILRCSCIYGPRQSQQEDQGWVAWFAAAITSGQTLRIFGDGKTTRDMLFVDDLVDLQLRILDGPEPRGCTLNVGGGPKAARSLLEVVAAIEELSGSAPKIEFHDERPGDQKVFITASDAAFELYGWRPTTLPEDGLRQLLGL
ncbi:MAG: NAD-dependent epimerase/dehydratase family protein [Proteobacteria bacterium]|nr:NAD-dependent epimerase/dehydratase family protein [Pseudomonadota bacterium]